jgi:hypothetical protein
LDAGGTAPDGRLARPAAQGTGAARPETPRDSAQRAGRAEPRGRGRSGEGRELVREAARADPVADARRSRGAACAGRRRDRRVAPRAVDRHALEVDGRRPGVAGKACPLRGTSRPWDAAGAPAASQRAAGLLPAGGSPTAAAGCRPRLRTAARAAGRKPAGKMPARCRALRRSRSRERDSRRDPAHERLPPNLPFRLEKSRGRGLGTALEVALRPGAGTGRPREPPCIATPCSSSTTRSTS